MNEQMILDTTHVICHQHLVSVEHSVATATISTRTTGSMAINTLTDTVAAAILSDQ